MNLDRVTITGADDSIDPLALVELTNEFPYVEWGLLFSATHQGKPRWPSNGWIKKLLSLNVKLPLSLHLCGKYVRDLVIKGKFTFIEENSEIWDVAQRIQLNFHGEYHKACLELPTILNKYEKQYILQMDGVNNNLLSNPLFNEHSIVPLFDISGGNGILPDEWPAPIAEYSGYAGGLSPDNLNTQLNKIWNVVGNHRIWIDVETRVRSDDDRVLDLNRVHNFLSIAYKFVKKKS